MGKIETQAAPQCSNAPVNVKPQGGGGGQTQGILTFSGSQSQIPHPWAPGECQIPAPWEKCFC